MIFTLVIRVFQPKNKLLKERVLKLKFRNIRTMLVAMGSQFRSFILTRVIAQDRLIDQLYKK